MSTTDDTGKTDGTAGEGGQGSEDSGVVTTKPDRTGPPRRPGLGRAAKRYGPFVVVAAVVAAAIAVFGGGDDGVDTANDGEVGELASVDEEELTRDGPMTPQKAELLGEEDVVFGPDCDPETQRIKLPLVYAPQCVAPLTGDNGGVTSPGVTEDEILVVRYSTDPANDPLQTATAEEAGIVVDPDSANRTAQGYVDVYQQVFETYGRRVRMVPFTGSGAADDAEAARADARAIAEMEPFAVINGPAQVASVFADEIASRGIVCLGTCATAVPEEVIEDHLPYIWPAGQTPNQAAALAAELIGNLAGPGPAELAGDPELRDQDRVYGLVHYNNPDGDHTPVFEALRDELAEHDIELATDVEFLLDFARLQENARTMISQLEAAGVTTVIYYGDPISPATMTAEATAQEYRPEWILGPSLLADTAQFARTFDQTQWGNGFGIKLGAASGPEETDDAYRIYDWAYGTRPPNSNYDAIEPAVRTLFIAIHLAGPELTPDSFRDGLFRYVPSGGGPTAPSVSRGNDGYWDEVDYGGTNDASIIWWDVEAEGIDETGGDFGPGLYRFALGGRRYTAGNFPKTADEAGLFDEDRSVTLYDELPEEDQPPDYPPPF